MAATRWPLAVVLAMGLCAAPALAQTLDQQWELCGDKNADIRIGGCTAVIHSGRESTNNVAIAFIKRGLGYDWKGQHERAIEDYDQALRLNPANADAYYNRGIAYGRIGQADRSIQDYDQAIRIKPTYADAIFNRGIALARKGEHARAVQDFDSVLRLEPGAADARKARCDSLKVLGRTC